MRTAIMNVRNSRIDYVLIRRCVEKHIIEHDHDSYAESIESNQEV